MLKSSPMTTKRSLNKLEWKAHMSIHNTMEVNEHGEVHPDACFTRDRFGKKQEVRKADHSFRRRAPKVAAFWLFFTITLSVGFKAEARNVNVRMESEERKDLSFINEEKKREERVTFFKDDNAAIDINSEGEPNLNMRF